MFECLSVEAEIAVDSSQDEESFIPSEGFWREFFLLRPDKAGLIKVLDSISPEGLLHLQVCHVVPLIFCITHSNAALVLDPGIVLTIFAGSPSWKHPADIVCFRGWIRLSLVLASWTHT